MPVDYAGAVVEWVTGNQITLLELMKNKLDIEGPEQDDDLALYLDMAGTACENYIDNKIVSQEVTEHFPSSHSPITLRYWPAQDLTSLTIDGDEEVENWELISCDGLTWSLNNRCGNSMVSCFQQMLVTYSAGYDPVPSDIAYAIISTAISYEQQTGATGQIKKEVVNGVGSVEYVVDSDSQGSVGVISGPAIGVLEKYRRWHV